MKEDKTLKQTLLSTLPSVDEVLKSPEGTAWLSRFKRRIVLKAVRDVIASKRRDLLDGASDGFTTGTLFQEILEKIRKQSSFSLVPVINATGVVIHTNLGRAVLSEKILNNVLAIGGGYSNLEYDLEKGSRGKRHIHTTRLLSEITGAEDALIVNNNAAAVLLCLNAMAKGKEVIVSRSELVEIGGSFRVPDVMAASGAVLREVGTTNKTHLFDYENAVNENTALILKVHQSNYKIIGFYDDVKIGEMVALGKKYHLPVMYDLGSGCLLDLKPYGIHSEPSVQEIIKSGVDLVTFSGDKLLGGPQGGLIVGRKEFLEKIRKNPLARAVRTDKLTLAAFEATLMEYMDLEEAKREIPLLAMLLQSPEDIRSRAGRIAAALRRKIKGHAIGVVKDMSRAGGGSLPEADFPTYAVSIKPAEVTVNELEERLRRNVPPVIARISENVLLLDARTIRDKEVGVIVKAVVSSLPSV